jgi:hypothetical protein
MHVGMARDNSISSLIGSTQLALARNGNRQFLHIQNTGTTAAYVNFSGPGASGNPATPGSTGTIVLAVNEKWPTVETYVPQNAVNVAGTAGQPLIVLEG